MRKVFWYQYQDTATFVQCDKLVASTVSPSWYASYARRQVFATNTDPLVDWWFGLYSGIDRPHNKNELDPNLAKCTDYLYPDPKAIHARLATQRSDPEQDSYPLLLPFSYASCTGVTSKVSQTKNEFTPQAIHCILTRLNNLTHVMQALTKGEHLNDGSPLKFR